MLLENKFHAGFSTGFDVDRTGGLLPDDFGADKQNRSRGISTGSARLLLPVNIYLYPLCAISRPGIPWTLYSGDMISSRHDQDTSFARSQTFLTGARRLYRTKHSGLGGSRLHGFG